MEEEKKAPEPTMEATAKVAVPLKVQWHEGDAAPVPTQHLVKTVRLFAFESKKQLRVMQTADGAEYLDIYVDVV